MNGRDFAGKYDPDRDPSGAIGHAMADAIVRERLANGIDPFLSNPVYDSGKKQDPNARYRKLVANSEGLSISRFEDAEQKRELLIEIFPDRFGAGGRQDIGAYSDVQIGSLYQSVLTGAKRALKRDKKR